jgi:hypothetical protein
MTWESTPAVKRYYLLVFEFKPREYPVGAVSRFHLTIYNAPPCRNVIWFTLVGDFYEARRKRKVGWIVQNSLRS